MTVITKLHKAFTHALYTTIVLLGLSAGGVVSAQDVVLERIRAVVNEGVILDSDIESAILFFKQQARSNQQSIPPDAVLSERLLEQLINREIRAQHARKIGVAVDASSINRAIEQISRNNNMDTLQFRETIQNQGFDFDLFRQNIEQELLMQRLVEREVYSRIRVSAQEIDDYLDAIKNDAEDQQRHRIQHILIASPASATTQEAEAANVRAQELLIRLKNGADFSEEAAAWSDGARALQGGDLGWRSLQEIPGFLAEALQGMNPGDFSNALRSDNGLHIILLVDRQSSDPTQKSETLARHIFIAGNESAVEQRLQTAREQLRAGGSFKSMAAQMSEDPNSANNSGELPWFSQGQMPPAMEEMADTLEIDEISPPFRTQFGWHLIQVLDRRTRAIDEEALREQANNALRQSKVDQETQRWSRQLRDESFVEIRS